jgi:hypothetical protein
LHLVQPGSLNKEECLDIAELLYQAILGCWKVLSGKEPPPTRGGFVGVEAKLPALQDRKDPGPRVPDTLSWLKSVDRKAAMSEPALAPEGIMKARATGGAEAEAVDRFVELCSQVSQTSPGKFDPLHVLVIRRCGEPLGGRKEAYSRFAFGSCHWEKIKALLEASWKDLCDKIAEESLRLCDAGISWSRVAGALKNLGFSDSAVRSQERLSQARMQGDRSGFPKDKGPFRQRVETAFKKPFPVRAVVSNRIMGACLPEWVWNLWVSPGLVKTLKGYPLDTLLCEMAFFPGELGKLLYYVPLYVPPSRQFRNPEGYFLCYGVAMCSPTVISEEAFRAAVQVANQDLYLGFLEEAYLQLMDAAEQAKRCQEKLILDPETAKEALDEAVQAANQCVLDLLRLADFHVDRSHFLKKEAIQGGWGLEREKFMYDSGTRLVHNSQLRLVEEVTGNVFDAVLAERKFRNALMSRNVLNVEHSGLLEDLVYPIGLVRKVAAELKTRGEEREALTLSVVEAELAVIQSRWRLLVQRHYGQLSQMRLLSAEASIKIFDRALESLEQGSTDWARAILLKKRPKLFTHKLCGHFFWEEEGSLREMFFNLLSNRLKHERKRLESLEIDEDWGLELSWLTKSEVLGLPVRIRRAFDRWREDLRGDGACLIRAFPCTMTDRTLRDKLMSLSYSEDHQNERPQNMGLWVLLTVTRAYSNSEGVEFVPIAVSRKKPYTALLVLVPGR